MRCVRASITDEKCQGTCIIRQICPHPSLATPPTSEPRKSFVVEIREFHANPQPGRGTAAILETVTSRRYKDFRLAPLAPEAFHRQNCDMPDSDPSSTSSARSSRDLPAEEGGDYCRRRDDVRLASAISGLRQRQPLSRSLRMMERRQAMRMCIASLRMPRRVA
jgi:hypothetical protein